MRCRQRRELKRVAMLRVIPLELNLGCGPNRKQGWLNIDIFDRGADLRLDLREPWPFLEYSVSFIYSEHSFEHFDFFRGSATHLV